MLRQRLSINDVENATGWLHRKQLALQKRLSFSVHSFQRSVGPSDEGFLDGVELVRDYKMKCGLKVVYQSAGSISRETGL